MADAGKGVAQVTEKLICTECGAEVDAWEAVTLMPSRRKIVYCPKCYKEGARAADTRRYIHAEQLRRKRNKDKAK